MTLDLTHLPLCGLRPTSDIVGDGKRGVIVVVVRIFKKDIGADLRLWTTRIYHLPLRGLQPLRLNIIGDGLKEVVMHAR